MITYNNIMLRKWLKQNSDFLNECRIQKIQQPTRRDFIFFLRKKGETRKLYININPQYYHIAFMSPENENKRLIEIPQKPPMFCMLLRKYLENSVISKVYQPKYERIMEIYVETYNELSEKIYLCLTIELMGKHSNAILYNYDTNIILGCAHNVGTEKSRERELAGGLPYIYPPNSPQQWFTNETLSDENNINKVIDDYYAKYIYNNKLKTTKENLKQIISKKIKKDKNSLEKMETKLNKESSSDKYRLKGDLIMANLYNNKDFSKSIKVYDYENDKEIIIELDETKTLKENANNFYKLYNKGKNSTSKLSELTAELKEKINYLEHILYSIEIAESIEELNEIKIEIEPQKDSKKIQTISAPLELNIENCKVFVGRNNRQNDYIVSKLSKDEDLWFHTKDCAGSHVLLKCENPSDKIILKCAELAKKYSKGSKSSKVGVIYTKRKNLKKPPKANLGYVTYKNEKEILI